jgi:hypothetical protein
LEKVYLWGIQVYGESPGEYLGATGDFGSDGDRLAWERFLQSAAVIFDEHGDIRSYPVRLTKGSKSTFTSNASVMPQAWRREFDRICWICFR